jgi:hypothetical protein
MDAEILEAVVKLEEQKKAKVAQLKNEVYGIKAELA